MPLQARFLRKRPMTDMTTEGLESFVHSINMFMQIGVPGKAFVTHGALELLDSFVNFPDVKVQVTVFREYFVA